MNKDEDIYISSNQATKNYGITAGTLRNWFEKGKLRGRKTPSNRLVYSKTDLQTLFGTADVIDVIKEKRKICYARVSSGHQKDDLQRQITFLQEKYPGYEVISDIGSGINWERKGFKTILEQSMLRNVSEVVVTYRDRLCRFGYDIIKFILEKNGVKLTLCNQSDIKSYESELADDIMSIIHVYTMRQLGRRRYHKNKEIKNLSKSESEKDIK